MLREPGMLKTSLSIIFVLAVFCAPSFAKEPNATVVRSTVQGEQSITNILDLGARYEHGEEVSRDPSRARELYCDAARLESPDAYFRLGWMYLNGRGVSQDDDVAAFWLRKAADHGIVQAANILHLLSGAEDRQKASCSVEPDERVYPTAQLRKLITAKARAAGVDYNLVAAVIAAESNFNPNAVSPKNARGLMQLTSATAKRFGVQDPFNVDENLRGGITFLSQLIQRFHGDVGLALAAYNAGEGAVEEWGGIPPYKETTAYIGRVTTMCGCSVQDIDGKHSGD